MESNVNIMKLKSWEYQLVYYEVYCNAYIRYALIDFFDDDNTEYMMILKSIDKEELMKIIDKVIHKLTIEKLEVSFGNKLKYL
ncbi:hypothetical protein SDC9_159095 [bioreactor metagenome]|uniref:Uncharacterized protein n=1 Tax=bioreactor metagenome TaxID=1076179 RepID=A0A645FBZ0_9ZZZZ